MAQEPKFDFDFMPSPVGERLPSPNDEIIQFALESDNHNLQALANDFVQYVQTIEQNDEDSDQEFHTDRYIIWYCWDHGSLLCARIPDPLSRHVRASCWNILFWYTDFS